MVAYHIGNPHQKPFIRTAGTSRNQLCRPSSALAQETLKDPYLFDFLSLGEDAQEREIENALVQHITRFLLDLGIGQRLCLCWTAVSFGSERR
ncbi:PDDEXK nuclease domain-containing protein [Aggregatibacter actinomycetemcomitans]|uniref:PDDEXK nuclease domain-containing protein n=1 Tax=Aggregatibacter actinomycetemcomitans TaxID=714 RepID=UPI0032B7DCE9